MERERGARKSECVDRRGGKLVKRGNSPSGTGVGHVDTDASAVKLLLVKGSDGGVSLLLRGVGDETETTRATSLAVLHDNVVSELTVGRESLSEAVISGVPREVSDVDLGSHCERSPREFCGKERGSEP